jgi:hypothetical protein
VLGDGDTGVVAHGGSNGGVMGFGFGSEGIYGASGGGLPIGTTPGMTRNGVHGVTDSQTDAGVFGEAIPSGGHAAGTGVTGLGQTGVHGKPLSGGTGVKADPADDGTGLALDATGPVQFEGSTKFALSGIASIAGSSKSASVTNVSLRAGSLVLAMLQNDVGVSVDSAIPDATGSKIMINLNKSVPNGKTAKVAWFIVN